MKHLISLIVAALAVTNFSQAAVTVTSVRPQGGRVLIEWQGGTGPYLVETSRDLSTWSDLDTPASARRLEAATSTKVSFFRITDLNPESVFGPLFGQVQTDQGEFGPLLARHRLKSRLWFYKTQGPPHTSPSSTPLAYFRSLHVLHQHHDAGRVQTWVGQLQDLGVVATPSQNRMTVSWSRGTGRALRQFVLELEFPYSVTTPRARAPLPSDPYYLLRCTYSTPVPELDGWPPVLKDITKEETALYQLDPNNGTAPFPAARKYRVSERGADVDLHFLEGVPLIQGDPPFIWKTYILDRWLSPTVARGGNLPAFTTDSWFSRTLLPGHHNFVETVLIEPALDPMLSEASLQALRAANIQFVHTFKDIDIGVSSDEIFYIGFDGRIHHP